MYIDVLSWGVVMWVIENLEYAYFEIGNLESGIF